MSVGHKVVPGHPVEKRLTMSFLLWRVAFMWYCSVQTHKIALMMTYITIYDYK